ARSPRRCSCSVSSRPPKAGCMLIFTAGRHRPGRRARRAANAKPRAPSTNCCATVMDDPRMTPARPDLAAKYLEGKVKAARFVTGEEFEISDAIAPLRSAPSPDAELATQALRGERATIYDRNAEGWAWGQLSRDGYVGWLSDRALAKPQGQPTHKITAIRTFAFPGPPLKLPPVPALTMATTIIVARRDGAFAVTREGWYLPQQHVGSVDQPA